MTAFKNTKNTLPAIVFAGRNGLDFMEMRSSVLRIPEVTIRIGQAQAIIDQMELGGVDLMNIISSEDESFFRNIQMKSLASAIVQVGLYDRYLKTSGGRRPEFMVGQTNGDSAMLVCSGQLTFEQMVRSSLAITTLRPVSSVVVPLIAEAAPVNLSGTSLTEFQAVRSETSDGIHRYVPVNGLESAMDLRKIIANLNTQSSVNQFVNIGPGAALRITDFSALGSDEVEWLDSIEIDPLLGWFWRGMRPMTAVAQ